MTNPNPLGYQKGEPPQIVDLQRAYDTVGHTTGAELRMLAKYAAVTPAAIVELGTYLGRSAIALALAAKWKPVYTVDMFTDAHLYSPGGPRGGFEYHKENRDGFLANIEKAGLTIGAAETLCDVAPIHSETVKAGQQWRGEIGLLFVDADHNEEPLRADLAAWTPHVVNGGYLALHDYNDLEPGVMANAAELLASGDWERIDGVHSLAVFQRIRAAVVERPVAQATAPVEKKPARKAAKR